MKTEKLVINDSEIVDIVNDNPKPITQFKQRSRNMKAKALILAGIFMVAYLFSISSAQVPQMINYQGKLTKAGTCALDTTIAMVFKIYADTLTSTSLWTETQSSVKVEDGIFNILLGSVTPFADLVFDGNIRYLGVKVGADNEMTPRKPIVSAGYAFRSEFSDTARYALAGAGGGIGGSGTTNYISKFTGSNTIGNSVMYQSGNYVGIGLTNPSAVLHLHGADNNIRLTNSNTGTNWNDGIQLSSVSNGSLDASLWNRENGYLGFGTNNTERIHITADGKVGVGISSPNAKLEVTAAGLPLLRAGDFKADYLDPSTHVLHAEFTGTGNYDATAVYGKSTPAQNFGRGGYFEGGFMGAYGQVYSTTIGNYYGVIGNVNGGDGTNYGVRGGAWDGTTNYGVYGDAGGGTTNWAGYFSGNVNVTGTLSKGGGSFKIDHPLDPENKYLYHSFVESPDMKNVYDGIVILDANGGAKVQLPDYFEALNKDFRYQLTCIGGFAPVYIAEEISGNSFKIAGGQLGMKISWQVTGIREDPFAEANRIQVEVNKPAEERGKYLYPKAYGLSEKHGIDYEMKKQAEMKESKEKIK
jgi:hypothetical protein